MGHPLRVAALARTSNGHNIARRFCERLEVGAAAVKSPRILAAGPSPNPSPPCFRQSGVARTNLLRQPGGAGDVGTAALTAAHLAVRPCQRLGTAQE
jgi:hypothetical protein